jgi:hypothetical protein
MRTIDRTFDLLNSKSKYGLGFKTPLSKENTAEWQDVFLNSTQYISTLTDVTGKPMILTLKRTGFLGFIVGMKAFAGMFETFVETGKLEYILTFKNSQDHLEQTFSAHRGGLGRNTNPTPTQFKASFKKLMVGASFKVYMRSNALQQDGTALLDIFTSNKQYKKYVDTTFDLEDEFETFEAEGVATEYQKCIVEYIAGYSTLKVTEKEQCECHVDLKSAKSKELKLINFKDLFPNDPNHGLVYPSKTSIKVCEIAEKLLREASVKTGFLRTPKLLLKLRDVLKQRFF